MTYIELVNLFPDVAQCLHVYVAFCHWCGLSLGIIPSVNTASALAWCRQFVWHQCDLSTWLTDQALSFHYHCQWLLASWELSPSMRCVRARVALCACGNCLIMMCSLLFCIVRIIVLLMFIQFSYYKYAKWSGCMSDNHLTLQLFFCTFFIIVCYFNIIISLWVILFSLLIRGCLN